jgi:hypothetical protein
VAAAIGGGHLSGHLGEKGGVGVVAGAGSGGSGGCSVGAAPRGLGSGPGAWVGRGSRRSGRDTETVDALRLLKRSPRASSSVGSGSAGPVRGDRWRSSFAVEVPPSSQRGGWHGVAPRVVGGRWRRSAALDRWRSHFRDPARGLHLNAYRAAAAPPRLLPSLAELLHSNGPRRVSAELSGPPSDR